MNNKIQIEETDVFEKDIHQTVTEMKDKNKNEYPIMNGSGMVIVKCGTPEAIIKEKNDLVWYKTEIKGDEYFICRA